MLTDIYQEYIHKSRYARYRDDLGRRETWEESVDRYMQFMKKHLKDNNNYDLPDDLYYELKTAILNTDIMPSMRALMTAGRALEKDHVSSYNCSFLAMDNSKCFDEIMYILMCGTGVGFSVEQKFISQLPEIPNYFYDSDSTIVVCDSKIGWATAFREFIAMLYSGKIVKYDLSRIRSAGARLKTFGGRASGPAPLKELLEFTKNVFTKAKGRKLYSDEIHDIVCKIADIVIVGGVAA